MLLLTLNLDARTESLLSLSYYDLIEEVGFYLGFGAERSSYTDGQMKQLDRLVQNGLRQFYYPPAIPDRFGNRRSHVWGFIRPERSLQLTAGTWEYELPDLFGDIVGTMNFAPGEWNDEVEPASIAAIRARRQATINMTGPPRIYAVALDETTPALRRYKLMLWPTPDSAYTLYYQMALLQNPVGPDRPYVYGGEMHAETIRASCLAAAESYINDSRGEKYAAYLERLEVSVQRDIRQNEPKTLGYNRDNSQERGRMQPAQIRRVTIDGVLPG
jgi:hypothetical protein